MECITSSITRIFFRYKDRGHLLQRQLERYLLCRSTIKAQYVSKRQIVWSIERAPSCRVGSDMVTLCYRVTRRGEALSLRCFTVLYKQIRLANLRRKTPGYGTVVFIPSLGVTGWSTVSICSTTRQMSDWLTAWLTDCSSNLQYSMYFVGCFHFISSSRSTQSSRTA